MIIFHELNYKSEKITLNVIKNTQQCRSMYRPDNKEIIGIDNVKKETG